MSRVNNGRKNVGLPSVKPCETFQLNRWSVHPDFCLSGPSKQPTTLAQRNILILQSALERILSHESIAIAACTVRMLTLPRSTIVEQVPKICPSTFVGNFFHDSSQENSLCAQDAFSSFAKQIIIYLDAIGRTCSVAVINAVKRYFAPDKPLM